MMAAGAKQVAQSDVEERERKGGGPASRDIAGALESDAMTIRAWRFGPGDAMPLHRHRVQEEIYHLLAGGPQNLEIAGEAHAVNDGDWVRVSNDTPRRINNTSDREASWLILGAPPGERIMDGVRLDPATGEEIPRA